MSRLHLRKAQLAELGQVIGKHGFAKSDFRWREVPSEGGFMTILMLEHTGSRARATFKEHRGTGGYGPRRKTGPHDLILEPGAEIATGDFHSGVHWDDVVKEVNAWLERVREDAEAPSFAEALEMARTSLEPVSLAGPEESFAPDEVAFLRQTLDDLAGRLAAELPSAEADLVRQELDELKKEVATLTKGRWVRMAQGALVSLVVRSLVPQEAVGHAWEMLVEALKALGTVALPP